MRTVFFAYSGHGASIPDETGEEEDGRDEILCPVDLGRYLHEWQVNAITDDFLFRKFHDELPLGVKCVCSYDCCHSGTISDLPTQRGMAPRAPAARATEQFVSRSMDLPEEVEAAIYRTRLMAGQQVGSRGSCNGCNDCNGCNGSRGSCELRLCAPSPRLVASL